MRECMTETMYEKLGISKEVYEFGQTIEAGLKERFSQMDEVAEYNQLKVLHAMQENKVSEGCFNRYRKSFLTDIRFYLWMRLKILNPENLRWDISV